MNGRADSLTGWEIESLIAYGDLINVKVTVDEVNGRTVAHFLNMEYTDYYAAMAYLQRAANVVCAGQAA